MGHPRFGRKKSEPGSNTNREANSKVLRRLSEETSLWFIKVRVIRLLISYYYYHSMNRLHNKVKSSFCRAKAPDDGGGAGDVFRGGS